MNLKQTLFVTYYTEGDTRGNCEQSMLKAGYKAGHARKNQAVVLKALKGNIDDRLDDITGYKTLKIETIGGNFLEDRRLAKNKGHIGEMISADVNLAKHVGFFLADNLQRTEQAKLTEQQVKEAKMYAKWRLLTGLNEPQEAKEGTQQAAG